MKDTKKQGVIKRLAAKLLPCSTSSKHQSPKTIIYPGTFDPITYGHIDIIERASQLFDKVIVAISASHKKNTLFSLSERLDLATQALAHLSNIETTSFDGLLVDFARQQDAFVILRGMRAISDFEHEFQLVGLYKQLDPRIETLFLSPAPQYLYISASMVREIASLGGDVAQFAPPVIQKALQTKQQ
jgi:pantetheine-phosphate adenylyltransferase